MVPNQTGYFPDCNPGSDPGLLLVRVFCLPIAQAWPNALANAIVLTLGPVLRELNIHHVCERCHPTIAALRSASAVKDFFGQLPGNLTNALFATLGAGRNCIGWRLDNALRGVGFRQHRLMLSRMRKKSLYWSRCWGIIRAA